MNIFDENYLDRLHVVSFDDSNGEPLFDDDTNRYVNFDKKVLKKIYKIIEKGYCDTLSAVDTVIQDSDRIYLIEFKNQTREKIKKYEIYSKAMESLALLQKYIDTREYKIVLLIIFSGYDKSYKRVGKTYSLENMPIEFGLCRYNKIIFDEIYTMDKRTFLEFKDYFHFARGWR